jgi:hypothetical protein
MPVPQKAAATGATAAANISMKQTAGSSSSSDTTAARDTHVRLHVAAAPGSVKSSGPAAAVGGSFKPVLVPAVPIQQQQQQRRPESQQQQQQQDSGSSNQQASSSSGGGRDANEQPGKAKKTAPAGQEQQSWYAAAWHTFRSAVWGTPVDLMQLGPPWTKWPGGWWG